MTAFTVTTPDVQVDADEYRRLLGYPRGRVLEGRALELAEMARAWYAEHGRPWVHARELSLDLSDGLRVGGERFASPVLERTLRDAGADRVVLVAASAGPELEQEAQQRWRDEKPDEYFFLEIYGSAVVEHLVMTTGARLCAEAAPNGLAVLPHQSPGYAEWDVAEQARLRALLGSDLPGPLDALDSGMLWPKKSLLAVFGLTPHVERVRPLTDLVPCEGCSLVGCRYRRAPYGGRRRRSTLEAAPVPNEVVEPVRLGATYVTSARALRRWAAERLTLRERADGGVDATFRYEGTTCSNTGRPLCFVYDVSLGPRDARYPIVSQRCAPAPDDDGYTFMCSYRRASDRVMAAIAEETPLAGRPIDDVLAWTRPSMAAGCYCEGESRMHKWGLVLETIHFALAERERRGAGGS